MSEIIEPKVGKPKNLETLEIEPFWANHDILLFLRMRFFNFFLNHMGQKYQNEIAPIFYYGISAKKKWKRPKNTQFTAPWLKKSLLNVPV